MNFPQLLLDSPRHRSPHCSPHTGLIFTLIFSPQSRGCLEGTQRQHPGVIQELRRCHGKHPKRSNPHRTAGFDPGQSGTPKIRGGERSGMWGLWGWTSTSSRVRTHKNSFPLHAQSSCSMCGDSQAVLSPPTCPCCLSFPTLGDHSRSTCPACVVLGQRSSNSRSRADEQ